MASVRLAIRNPHVREELEGTIFSIAGLSLVPESSAAFDLLIVEIGKDHAEEFRLINEAKNAGVEVFLTSSTPDPQALIEAMRAGVKEFFPQPLDKENIKKTLTEFTERREIPNASVAKGRIINVMGSKGGVGTTTVAVNLASSLKVLDGIGLVALLDMNVLFGEIPLFLGIKPDFDWIDFAKNISRHDAGYLMEALFEHSSGVHVLPSPVSWIDESVLNPQVVETLLGFMRTIFDFIIIDSGRFLNGISKTLLKLSDVTLLVTTLTLASLVNAKRLLAGLKGFDAGQENIQVLVNRCSRRNLPSRNKAELGMEKSFFWSIPNDYEMTINAINQGMPLSSYNSRSSIHKEFVRLASALSGKKEKRRRGYSELKLVK